MASPQSSPPASPDVGFPASPVGAGSDTGTPWREAEGPSTAELLTQLGEDRLWLLRQLDSGRWSEWRLDLAALERELGQLIYQAGERF